MRFVFLTLILVLFLGKQESKAQLGGWFLWGTPSYEPTTEEYASVVEKINSGEIRPGIWYSFASGQRYQVLQPNYWLSTLTSCYQIADATTTINNLPDRIRQSQTAVWGLDISSTTSNYYYSEKLRGNKVTFVPRYCGRGRTSFIFKGLVVMFPSCGNPQGNEPPPPVPVVPIVTTPVATPCTTVTNVINVTNVIEEKKTAETADDGYFRTEEYRESVLMVVPQPRQQWQQQRPQPQQQWQQQRPQPQRQWRPQQRPQGTMSGPRFSSPQNSGRGTMSGPRQNGNDRGSGSGSGGRGN